MHILLGFILIVTGLLMVTYFSGPKNTPQQSSLPQQSQVQALPVNSPTSANTESTVVIRNKKTGEIKQVPRSQVSNYAQATQQPKIIQPSDKALKLAAYMYWASNESQRKEFLSKMSDGKNDEKLAITNLALLLDSKPDGMVLAEELVAIDLAKKKSQAESEAILEYHEKEYERIKAEYDNIPQGTNYTYTSGTKNTATTPIKSGSTQVSFYQDNTQEMTDRLKNMLSSPNKLAEDILNSPYAPTIDMYQTYKQPVRYDVIGDSVYGSDGSRYYQVGDSIYKNDGTKFYTVGDSLYGSDGSKYYQVGDSVYKNDGTRYDTVGDTVYGSDGSKYYQVGDSIYAQPGY